MYPQIDKESFCRALVRGVTPATASWLWEHVFAGIRAKPVVTLRHVLVAAIRRWSIVPPTPWCIQAGAFLGLTRDEASSEALMLIQSAETYPLDDLVASEPRCTDEFLDRLIESMESNPLYVEKDIEGFNIEKTIMSKDKPIESVAPKKRGRPKLGR